MALSTLLLTGAMAPASAAPEFPGQDQELLYYWGTTFGEQLEAGGVAGDADAINWVLRGLQDRIRGEAPEFGEESRSLLNNFLVRRRQAAAAAEAELAKAFVADTAKEKGARVTERGVVFREMVRSKGARPAPDSRVRVHYTGTLRDGTVFDDSRARGAPLEARLDRVIDCWREAIPLMTVGSRARFTCPPELAYGEQGSARIPGGAALSFEVELLGIVAD
jgi:FKBP-type peptidyl-prolyl cis-trans isomerase FkpA